MSIIEIEGDRDIGINREQRSIGQPLENAAVSRGTSTHRSWFRNDQDRLS